MRAIFFGDQKTSEYYGNNTFVRGGASGKTKINDDISAIGFYEGQIKLSNAESEAQKDSVTINGTTYNTNSSVGTNLTTRFVYGGLDVKNVGAFTFGRQFGAIKHVVGWTDVGLTSDYTGNATGNAADKFGTGRSSDQFKYVGTFGQAKVFTNYKFASNRDSATLDKDSTAFGFGSSYDISQKVSIGAAYADGNRAQTTAGVDAKDAKLWVTGAKYDDKTIYAALVYANGTDFLAENVDHTAFETALGYTFKNGFGPG
jgi:outer membrane pore protein E